jgi:spore coat polysaccharide biosynthesis protein SpsF
LATEPHYREHVTLYAYRNPDQFSITSVRPESDWSHLRWTVDTQQDLQLVQDIYRYFGEKKFDWHDIVQAYPANPGWIEINRNSIQKVA